MIQSKENIPFSYQRGKLKIIGRTDSDRRSARIDTICYWVYRLIIASGLLLSIIYRVF
jgi:hypothetical protein